MVQSYGNVKLVVENRWTLPSGGVTTGRVCYQWGPPIYLLTDPVQPRLLYRERCKCLCNSLSDDISPESLKHSHVYIVKAGKVNLSQNVSLNHCILNIKIFEIGSLVPKLLQSIVGGYQRGRFRKGVKLTREDILPKEILCLV